VCVVVQPLTVWHVGSGVIYAVIIGLWGAYFIPLWLRRQEEMSESRSVERFTRAMRILSRKAPTPDQRYVVMPRRPDEVPGPRRRPPARAPKRVTPLAMRRRRILAGLALTTLIMVLVTPFTPVPWLVPVALLFATVGDLVHLRIQARRQGDVSRTRESVRNRTRARLRRFDSVERLLEAKASLSAERAAAAEAAGVAEREEAARLASDAAGWQPVPVPLPTYVTKPRAPDRPAAATAEREPFDQISSGDQVPSQRQQPSGMAEVDESDELDEIIERRRAVND
jgi:hypothetical protein